MGRFKNLVGRLFKKTRERFSDADLDEVIAAYME